MNVVYHSSELFSPVLGASIASLLESNKKFDAIDIYVIENRISEANKANLQSLVADFGRRIFFIPMPDVNKEEQLGLKMIKDNWLFDSYCRMFLDKYLPDDVDRVLYLDSDVLIVDDLTELWNTDLQGNPAGVVKNCVSEEYFKLFKMNDTSLYCNSGVVLIDLKEWHARDIGQRVRDCVAENNGYVFFMEQTVLSVVLQDELYVLHPRYNALTEITNLTYDEMMTFRRPKRYYTREEFEEAKKNPAIIHMTNSFLITNRCWYENTNHPAKDIYRKYYGMTPWKDQPLFQDHRSQKKKLIQTAVNLTPRKVLLPMVSFVYNYIRVWNIKKDMRKYSSVK